MKHWKRLSRDRRGFALAVPGVPLLLFLLSIGLGCLINGSVRWLWNLTAGEMTLSGFLCLFGLPALAVLLGLLNLLLLCTGNAPGRIGWDLLLLFALGLSILAQCYFLLGELLWLAAAVSSRMGWA
jgi:hypothetical protein